MSLQSFVSRMDGIPNVSYDGIAANKGQCVQIVALYVRDELKLPVYYADAVYWYERFDQSPLKPNFTKIEYNGTNFPEPGDLVVWSAALPNSNKAGHIDICLDSITPKQFAGFDTNWNGKYCHRVVHTYDYVLGWLHPNNKSQEDIGMNEKEVKSQFWVVLHRDPKTEDEWKGWVGRSVQEFDDAMAAGPEWLLIHDIVAKRYPNDQEVIKKLREQTAGGIDSEKVAKLRDALKDILG